MDVHLRDLRYFVAVAEELHFTRAAERLLISQPRLSKQIRQLEQLLGVQLLERDHRHVALTDAGAALLPIAQDLCARWDDAERALTEASKVLRVGFSTSIGRGLLPAITRRFTKLRPDWRLQLRQVGWDDPTAGLMDRSTDVALVWAPLPESDRLRSTVVRSEPRWVALSDDHPLAEKERLAFDDLIDEPFLALPRSAGPLRDHWLALDARGDREVVVAAEVRNADETFEAVANGVGVVLLAQGNAEIYERPGIVTRPVLGLSPSHLVIAWRAEDRRAAVHDLVTAAVEARDDD